MLVLAHHCQFSIEAAQVQPGDFLVKDLGESVDLVSVLVGFLVVPEFKLGQGLVAEGIAHDE